MDCGSSRRGFLSKVMAAFAAGILGRKAYAAQGETRASELVAEGEVLRARVCKGIPPAEPLDTMIRFERSDENNGRPMTHEILSLLHEEKGKRSYPWTIYSHLTTHHVEGDACVLCSRLHKKDAGWSCGLHSEVFNEGRAVGLGINVEMNNSYGGPEKTEMIGINVQAHGPYDSQYGIQIHDADGHFEKGIGLNGRGEVGLDIAGSYGVGIRAHANSIRVDEGTCIELDGTGRIRLRYQNGRIEFLNGKKCVGHIDVDGEDHAL